MIEQTHSIQKINFDLNFATQEAAEKARRQYLTTFKRSVLPALTKVFDSYAKADEIIRINRLTIDLGAISPSPNATLLNQSIIQQIKKQLEVITVQKNNNAEKNIQIIELSASKMELIIHFLKYGYLPNTAIVFSFQEIMANLLEEKPISLVEKLKEAHRKNGDYILGRLVYQSTEAFLFQLLNEVLGLPIASQCRKMREQIIIKKVADSKSFPQDSLVALYKMAFSTEVLNFKPSNSFFKKIKIALLRKEEHKNEPTVASVNQFNESTSTWFCQYAGLILLHPFLSQFFQELGLLNTLKQFKNDATQLKAVTLLNYLANDVGEIPEQEIVFQKIICGVPLATPMPLIALSLIEKEEAKKMLTAVIKLWDALGNSSPDGLREGFLSRAGKFQKQENGWLLQIEPKTIDILIDKLPWNLAMVKLPWLKEMIWVEWR